MKAYVILLAVVAVFLILPRLPGMSRYTLRMEPPCPGGRERSRKNEPQE